MIDFILGPSEVLNLRQNGTFGGGEGPVISPWGSFLDPLCEEVFLNDAEGVLFFGGRHVVIVLGGESDALNQEGFGGVSGDDGGSGIAAFEREILCVQPEPSFNLAFIGTVTSVAIL